MQCIVCESEKTFFEGGIWQCHDCGSRDVEARDEDTEIQGRHIAWIKSK